MREVELTKGYVTLVDDEDYALVSPYTWHAYVRPNRPTYAYRSYRVAGRVKSQGMHQLLTGYRRTDHQDGDGLNNQRSNLREATDAQNSQNKRLLVNNTSGYKGVHRRRSGRYYASISVAGRHVYLGRFGTAEEAARSYDAATLQYFGEWAKTNHMLGLLL